MQEDMLPLKTPETQKITGDWVLFHPVYTPSELKAVDVGGTCVALRSILIVPVQVLHRSPQTLSDKFAYGLARSCRYVHIALLRCQAFFEYSNRWGFDFVSGYKHKPIPPGLNLSLEELRKQKYVMDEKQWMTVRLESLSSPVRSNDLHTANPIPRVYRGRTRNGRGHSSPPQEHPSHGMSHSCSLLLYFS